MEKHLFTSTDWGEASGAPKLYIYAVLGSFLATFQKCPNDVVKEALKKDAMDDALKTGSGKESEKHGQQENGQ